MGRRRFVSIKPIDQMGEKPDRPSDEVLWDDLQNVWFDVGVLKKRPALVTSTFSSGIETESPAHIIQQYTHVVDLDVDVTLRPSGAGANTNWTQVGGAANWSNVNDLLVIDGKYVYADASLEKDSYVFSNTSLTVLDKLTFSARARRDIGGAYTITFFARTGGSVEKDVGTVTIPKSTTGSNKWEDFTLESTTDPHTSAAWTTANVNAYEFGYYATYATVAVTEWLAPSGDGSTYSQWEKFGGATYNAILAGNAPHTANTGSPNTWTSYVHTDVNSEKFGVTFGPPVNNFSTITSIQPVLHSTVLFGRRETQLLLKDNGNEEIYLQQGYTTAGVDTQDYDEYIAGTFIPTERTWWAPDYTTDPLTDAVFDPSTAFTYEWIVATTANAHEFAYRKHLAPDSITSTDWVMRNKSSQISGTLTGTVSGSPSGSIGYSNSGLIVQIFVTVNGTFTGTIRTDNLEIPFSQSVALPFYGNIPNANANPYDYSGPYVGTAELTGDFPVITGDGTGGSIEAKFTSDSKISVTLNREGTSFTASGTISGASVTLEPIHHELVKAIELLDTPDASLFTKDAYDDDINDDTELIRNSTYLGDFPLAIGFEDMPTVPNYHIMSRLAQATYMSCYIDPAAVGSNPRNLTLEYTINTARAYTFQHSTTWSPARYQGYVQGNNIVADINTENIEFRTASDGSGTWVNIRGITRRIFFKAYPASLVYSFELKVIGTSGVRPAISDFFVTVEGSTSTALRESKLLVTQTDFYRWGGAAALTDIVGTATAPTGGPALRWDTTRFNGKQYFTNGTDNIYRYPNGSNEIDELTTIAKARTVASYIGRLFLGNTVESATVFKDRVRWSIVSDDSDFTTTGSGHIDLDETEGEVVKLLPLGGVLVGYKSTSLFNLAATGDRDDAIVKQLISPGIGAVAGSTILNVVARDGLPAHIFLGQGRGGYNVYMYTGNMLIPIGDDIKEELRDNINPRQAKNAFAIVDQKRNQYLFFVCYTGETFPHRAWTYDIDTGSWKHWEFPPITCAGYWETDEAVSSLQQWTMLLGQGDSTVKWLDPETYQDAVSLPIELNVESGDWAVEPRVNYATLYRLNIHHLDKGYTPVTVRTSVDGGDNYSDPVTVYLGQADGSADGSLRVAKADLITTGTRFRIKIEHDDNAAIAITELIMEIQDQGWIA